MSGQTVWLERYRLLRPLGAGASGRVFAAIDLLDAEKTLALKALDEHADPIAAQRLRAEFQALSRLAHPNLVRVFDLHVVPGTSPFLMTMELIRGGPLLQVAQGLEFAQQLELIGQTCRALDYLHGRGVVHRDIKSDNLLVAEDTGGGRRVVLTDFDLSGADGLHLSQTAGGTLDYLPPEVARGVPGDRRADLYSLGVLLFRLLTGEFPYPSPASVQEVGHGRRRRAHELAPHLDPSLCAIVERLLSTDPRGRPESARRLWQALAPHARARTDSSIAFVPPARDWPTVGRQEQLARLQATVDSAKRTTETAFGPRDSRALVAGEPAVGKSRLLAETRRCAQLQGMPVLTCRFTTNAPPLQHLRRVARELAAWARSASDSRPALGALLQEHHTLLEDVEPTMAPGNDAPNVFEEEKLTWFNDRLLDFFMRASMELPFVLFLEDIHLADRRSQESISQIFRTRAGERFACVASYCPDGPESSSAWLTTLREAASPCVDLEPLSTVDQEELLRQLFPTSAGTPALARQMDRLSGGRPAFIELVIENLRSSHALRPAGFHFELSPEALEDRAVATTVHEWVESYLSSATPRENEALQVLAAAKGSLPIAATAALLDDPGARETVDALVKRRILRASGPYDTSSVGFRHDLFRETVYLALPEEVRDRLHGKIADHLVATATSSSPPSPALVSHHLQLAGRIPEAAGYALEAGQRHLATFALEDAEASFRLALDGLDAGDDGNRLAAIEGLARSLENQRRFDDSSEQLVRLVRESTELGRQDFLARGLAGLAETHLRSARYDEAEELSQRALRIAHGIGDPATQARVLKAVADTYHYQSRLEEAKEAYAQLVSIRESLGDRFGSARAWHNLGWVSHSMRRFDEAGKHFRASANAYRDLDNPTRLSHALSAVGACELDAGRFRAAVEILTEALEKARSARSRRAEGLCLTNLGQALLRLGLFEQAGETLTGARALFTELEAKRYLAPVELSIGWVYTETCDYLLAEESLAQAREHHLDLEDQPGLAQCLASQGSVLRLLGDPTAARFWCERALEISRAASDSQVAAVCLTHLALACFEEERTQEAVDCLVEARSLARGVGAEDTTHLANLALARVLVLSGRLEDAPRLLDQALERAEAESLAGDIPVVLLLQAAMQLRLGNRYHAIRLAEKAGNAQVPAVHSETAWELAALQGALQFAATDSGDNSMPMDADRQLAMRAESVDVARRGAFLRRARDRASLFGSLCDASSHTTATMNVDLHRSATEPVATECAAPPESARAAPPRPASEPLPPTLSGSAQDLLAGSRLLASRLPDLHQQSRARCMLNTLVDRAVQMTRSDRGGLFLTDHQFDGRALDDADWQLLPIALRSLERESLKDARELSRSMVEAALQAGRPIASDELLAEPGWQQRLTIRVHEIPAVLALPLLGDNERKSSQVAHPAGASMAPRGVLYLDKKNEGTSYDRTDRRLASRVAHQLARILDGILTADGQVDLAALESRVDAFDTDLAATDEQPLTDEPCHTFGPVTIIGGHEMARVLDLVRRLARSTTPVLIHGETGTGKELVARAVHHASERRDGPFVAVDCGALSESMADAELFGHRKGAFTGAAADRLGLLRAAAGGTLFLDEIGNLTLPLQLKLLRALENREVRPVGEDTSYAADFRLVAATNADLAAEARRSRFRSDLFHRLKGGYVEIPPLREHMDDLELLVGRFLAEASDAHGKRSPSISAPLWEALHRHAWPGNVRELKMTIETAVALGTGDRLTLEDAPELNGARARRGPSHPRGDVSSSLSAADGVAIPDSLEGRLLLRTLSRCGWDKAATARRIGWSRQKVYREMERHGIPRSVPEAEMQRLESLLSSLSISDDFTAGA